MAFTLHFGGNDNDGHKTYGDGASYRFNDAGLLVVVDGEGQQITFSAAAWHLIEEAAAPPSTASPVPRRLK